MNKCIFRDKQLLVLTSTFTLVRYRIIGWYSRIKELGKKGEIKNACLLDHCDYCDPVSQGMLEEKDYPIFNKLWANQGSLGIENFRLGKE